MAAPVLVAPASRLFGSEIVGRHADPFIVAYLFDHPRGLGLFTQPATDYLGAVIAWLADDGIVAVNAVTLISFPLAALFAYFLAFRLSGSKAAAWLAALLYAFAPFHLAQSAYHAHGSQTQWLPLYLLSLWLCLERWSLGRAAILGLATALVVLSNYYYGFIAAVLTPVAVFGFWLAQGRRRESALRYLGWTLVSLGAICVAGIGYVLRSAPKVLEEPQAFAWPREDLLLYGARWWSYWAPPVEHPLFGEWSRGRWGEQALDGLLEQQLTIGIGLSALAVVAVAAYARDRKARELAAVPSLLALAAAAWLVSLAPAAEDGIGSWLRPSGLLYEVLPMFRAYARFGIVVLLGATLLAAMGAAWLWRRSSPAAKAASAALVALAAVELTPMPPLRWREVLPTSAHRWLAEAPEPVRLMDCVASTRSAERTLFFHYAPEVTVLTGIEDCGDPNFVVQLGGRGFTHLLVRGSSVLAGRLRARPAPPGLVQVGDFEDALLYAVEPAVPSDLEARFASGFHWREYKGPRSYRWMANRGTLTLTNSTDTPLSAGLDLELHSFAEPRWIDISLDGVLVAEIEVGTEIRYYSIGPLELAAGLHQLVLQARAPAPTADEMLGNGDLREISVALWNWRWAFEGAAQ